MYIYKTQHIITQASILVECVVVEAKVIYKITQIISLVDTIVTANGLLLLLLLLFFKLSGRAAPMCVVD